MYQDDWPAYNVKRKFVVKIYSVIFLQLAVTISMVYLTSSSLTFARFRANSDWVLWTAVCGFLFMHWVFRKLSLYPDWVNITKTFPTNYALLGLYYLFESYLASMLCFFFPPEMVLMTTVNYQAVVIGLAFYIATTQQNMMNPESGRFIKKGVFFSVFWIISSVVLLNYFLRTTFIWPGILALAFSYCLLLVTQLLLLGRRSEVLKYEDVILGAFFIRIDIILLYFIFSSATEQKKIKKRVK